MSALAEKRVYTYVYDESLPNVALSLLFRAPADTTDFGNTLFKLSSSPTFSWSTKPDSRYVYNVSDTEPNPRKYKAILLIHTRLEWKYSELFYMYRDTDYIYDRTFPRIRFSQCHTDYISFYFDKLYKAEPSHPPHFSRCNKRVGNVSIEFDEETTSFAFLSSLIPGYRLISSLAKVRPKSNSGYMATQLVFR
ncbi:MAG: hypothetical protein Q9181_006026 [Wetmoreana brouardii]